MELTPDIISKEFRRLAGSCYLDHAGTTLYAQSQLTACLADFAENLYGNPHSHNESSVRTSDIISRIRRRVLQFFGTTEDEYTIIFTSGCTASLRLLAESFFESGSRLGDSGLQSACSGHSCFCYLADNHTSVIGMREIVAARSDDAVVACVQPEDMEVRELPNCTYGVGAEVTLPSRLLDLAAINEGHCRPRGLFVYPAQSNFSGRKYPLRWIDDVRSSRCPFQRSYFSSLNLRWYVAIDAASYASSSPLDLSESRPDFATLSFYKIFGFPTGIGALLVRNAISDVLAKNYFGGGTVEMATVTDGFTHVFKKTLMERFEDGTVPFLDVVALGHGLDAIETLAGGMANVREHTFSLAQRTYLELLALRHHNGAPVAVVYCDAAFMSSRDNGPIVNFNLLRSDGSFVGFVEVERMATLYSIELRVGCVCNIGACQRFLTLSTEQLKRNHQKGRRCGGSDNDIVDGRPTGSVRVSFGYMSSGADVERLIGMVRESFVERAPAANSSRAASRAASDTASSRVTHIYVYPVKSCGPMQVEAWQTDTRGLLFDRRWMIVNENGACLTQKRLPAMCRILPYVDLLRRRLILSCLGHESVDVPLEGLSNGATSSCAASMCTSRVCGDRVSGLDCGNEVAGWICKVLQVPGCRLMQQHDVCNSESVTRRCKRDGAVTGAATPASELSLANEAQYLLVTSASLDQLSKDIKLHSGESLSVEALIRRLRPNLVVSSSEPYQEEQWCKVRVGKQTFEAVGPCGRCQMICIDQETCERSKEPLRTMTLSRGKAPSFGIYLSSPAVIGAVAVGDCLELLES